MPATTLRGRFVWHELMVTDTDAATRFYPGITGWKVEQFEHDPTYRLWTTGGAPMGGLMRLTDEARRMGSPPSWLMYVGTPDVDATVRQATSLGARTYVAPKDIPVGRFAVLADPQGAAFAVYKPTPGPTRAEDAGLGDFSWHELATTDWKAAWDFYRALFGWQHRESLDMGPAGTYWMFGHAGGERTLGGMYTKTPDVPAPRWLSYVRVPSADAAARAVVRLGGRVVNGPMDVPGGSRIAMCIDPQGAAFAVHSMAATPAAPRRATKPKGKKAKPRAKAKTKRKPARSRKAVRRKRR
ncbi:MAG TPA: VOC family protein [Gemmatimonadales bacterium]|nr:VOC family protein [Gemmatimonadales bacterium]